MTKSDKRLLKQLVIKGMSTPEILRRVVCAESTIRKYRRVFGTPASTEQP